MNILISDELLNGTITNQFEIELSENTITAQELIELRVYSEVESYNKKQTMYYKGLVDPSDAEKTLNGFKLKIQQSIDAEKQVYIALNAFQKNGFFILVDDKQIEELEQRIVLQETSKVSFVKLTPLVGG
jgi:hypothetical protein